MIFCNSSHFCGEKSRRGTHSTGVEFQGNVLQRGNRLLLSSLRLALLEVGWMGLGRLLLQGLLRLLVERVGRRRLHWQVAGVQGDPLETVKIDIIQDCVQDVLEQCVLGLSSQRTQTGANFQLFKLILMSCCGSAIPV